MTTYQELKRGLRSEDPRGLYLLVGPEEHLARELTSLIIDAALGDGMKDFNFIELDALTTNPPTLLQEINSYPLGSAGRVVLIRGANSLPVTTQEALGDAAADLPDFLTLIVTAERMDKRKTFYKAVAKQGVVVDLKPLRPGEVKAWIKERFKAEGKRVPSQLVDHIFELTGANLSEVANEVANLIAFMGENETVTQSEVDSLVSSRQKKPIYKLPEHVADGEFMAALAMLKQLRAEGEHELRILWHLDLMVKRMLRAKSMLEQGVREEGIMKALNIRSFLRQSFFRQVSSFPLSELKSMYGAIVEWDNKFKSTARWHPDIDMELLVRKLCASRGR
jgi:DNA polymerase-3 subunit delta